MLLCTTLKNESFEKMIEARSRVIIWIINHADSPEIAKLGLTQIADGFTNWNGSTVINVGGPGIVAAINNTQANHQLALGGNFCLPQKKFYNIFPCDIDQMLQNAGNNIDWIYAAKKLKLFKQNSENISGHKLYRSFVDSNCTLGLWETVFICHDGDGAFHSRYTIIDGSVFELKAFKFKDRPEIILLPFIPRETAVNIPFNFNGILTTDPIVAQVNQSDGMGWFCTAGGIENIDWKIFKNGRINPKFLWIREANDPLRDKNNFTEVFALATAARHYGINCRIVQIAREIVGTDRAIEMPLDDREIKRYAKKFRLNIDQVWIGLPGVIDFDDVEKIPSFPLPSFLQGSHHAIIFFGKHSRELMQNLLADKLVGFIKNLVIVPHCEQRFANTVHENSGKKTTIALYNIFDNAEVFQHNIPYEFSAIFLLVTRDDKFPDDKLSLCLKTGLPVMIFFDAEDFKPDGRNIIAACVKKSKDENKTFVIKNMKTGKIQKCQFVHVGVEETPGTETNMKNGD